MNSGELLNQLLIDLQSLFRSSFRKKKFTLSQINLISSIPINGIEMTSISSYLGIDNSTLTRNVNLLIKKNILKKYMKRSLVKIYQKPLQISWLITMS